MVNAYIGSTKIDLFQGPIITCCDIKYWLEMAHGTPGRFSAWAHAVLLSLYSRCENLSVKLRLSEISTSEGN